MSGPRIFISYRRNDTAGYAGRLHDALSARFGDDSVFMDIEIPIASDFRQVIADSLASTDLVLVLIGPSWLSIVDRNGRRRLDDPGDLLRLEVTEALQRDVRVLPVLVQGARMPAEEDLPEALAELARIQALELSDRRWRLDLEEFLETLDPEPGDMSEDHVDDRPEQEAHQRPSAREGPVGNVRGARAWWVGAAVLAVVVALVAIIVAVQGFDGGGDAAGGPEPTTTTTTPPAAADKIVFSNVERGGIMKVNADGTRQVTLKNDGSAPAPSPDGARIAFERGSDANRDIYLMDADGSNERRLMTGPGGNFDPAWSPDGRSIVFESRRDGNSEIYVVALDGLRPTRLTTHPATDSDPTFSADGRFIAFDSDRDGNREVYRMTASGAEVVRLTTRAEQDSDAAWSPDGRLIAFEAQRGSNFDIYVMSADGTGLRQLTTDPALDFNPEWSPDGRQLVFTRSVGASRTLFVMNADGSGQRQLADVPAGDPDWGAQ